MTTRRDFVQRSAAALGALSLAPLAPVGTALGAAGLTPTRRTPEDGAGRARVPLNILILGGTGFIGPWQVRYAVARGHTVTVFNRGRRQADLPDSVIHLQGDRDTGDLQSLEGKTWDVVIDNPTTLPFWVRDAGKVLAGKTKQYIFVSTISVYPHYRTAWADESYELAKYTGTEDALSITRADNALYGPLKARSELEAERWFPKMTSIVRPELIIGPGDTTDRFTYWPVRVARGGEVLAPGDGTDPIQFIDARDLSEFIVRLAESRTIGTFNATGPRSPLSMAEMLYGLRAAVSGSTDLRFTWVPQDFLAAQRVRGWSDMPTWVPKRPDNDGWSRASNARAVAAGLTFRPLAVTAAETLAWFQTLPAERQGKLLAGLTPEREQAVLQAWHQRPAPSAPPAPR